MNQTNEMTDDELTPDVSGREPSLVVDELLDELVGGSIMPYTCKGATCGEG